jgi:hypothetical protein
MENKEKMLSEKESLLLITQMINKAKNAYHDTGVSAIMWGAIIAICSIVKLAEVQFNFRLPFDIYLITFVAVIPQIYLSIKQKKRRKAATYDEAFLDAVWFCFGLSIFMMVLINGAMFGQWDKAGDAYKAATGNAYPFKLYEYNAAFFLLLYGMPTFVTGLSMKFKPMFWGGLVCWVSCIASLYTPYKIDLVLMAASAIAAWLIPGIIMMKNYHKAKQELIAADV